MRVYGDKPQTLPRRANKTFPKFIEVFDLDIRDVSIRLIMALQGDDEADGGKPSAQVEEEVDWDEINFGAVAKPAAESPISRGMEMDWNVLKQYVTCQPYTMMSAHPRQAL